MEEPRLLLLLLLMGWRCGGGGAAARNSPPWLLPNLWCLVSAEWRVLETSYPTGTVVEEEEQEEVAAVEVVVVAGVPADKGGPVAAEAAGREAPLEPSGCTSSQWPRGRGPWPCTTPYPCARAA